MANADRSAEQFRKMTETPIPKLILSLAAPTILSMLITSIYNLADTFFVGQISTSASGAVGIVSSLMAIIQALGFMFGHGSGNHMARVLGAGDAEDARQTELLHAGDIDCDVLKVPYHGRLVDASAAFLAACSPKIAFIPDSDEEAASPMVVTILKELGTDVHSGRDGDLVVVSDGKDVFVKHNN